MPSSVTVQDADDTSGSRLPDQPRIKPFSASQIDDATPPKIPQQFEMIGNFGIDSKWQRLRALIGSNKRIVFRTHVQFPMNSDFFPISVQRRPFFSVVQPLSVDGKLSAKAGQFINLEENCCEGKVPAEPQLESNSQCSSRLSWSFALPDSKTDSPCADQSSALPTVVPEETGR